MDALLSSAGIGPASPLLSNPGLMMGRMAPAAPAGAEKTAMDFEALFLSQMLQPMFATVDVDEVFGGGKAEEIMRGFMVQEYGKAIAAQQNTGIGAAVRNEIIRKQQAKGRSLRSKSQVDDLLRVEDMS